MKLKSANVNKIQEIVENSTPEVRKTRRHHHGTLTNERLRDAKTGQPSCLLFKKGWRNINSELSNLVAEILFEDSTPLGNEKFALESWQFCFELVFAR
jgi:hypothetical protein